MDTHRESELIEILKSAGWVTAWRLGELSTHHGMADIRKTLRILQAAGDVECRKIAENRPEHEWRWIDHHKENHEDSVTSTIERTDRRSGRDRRCAR